MQVNDRIQVEIVRIREMIEGWCREHQWVRVELRRGYYATEKRYLDEIDRRAKDPDSPMVRVLARTLDEMDRLEADALHDLTCYALSGIVNDRKEQRNRIVPKPPETDDMARDIHTLMVHDARLPSGGHWFLAYSQQETIDRLKGCQESFERWMANHRRLWFDDQGRLNQPGSVSLSEYLGELSVQLQRFLARLDSCDRTDTGDYLLRNTRAGNLSGMRVLWDNVVLLAQASIFKTIPDMTTEECATYKRDGIALIAKAPTRNAQPLTDALRQLLFSILYNADGSWVSEIPSATVANIRMIGDELAQHRAAWERSEGGLTRTPTVSVSPDLLDRLQRAAAAVDPGAIDRVAERAAEKMARVFGAGDNGDTKPPALPAGADESAGPALTANQSRVLQTMALFDASRLVSADAIAAEMAPAGRLSERTIGPIVRRLIELRLAERPEGDRSGARLTTAGRRLAPKIAD